MHDCPFDNDHHPFCPNDQPDYDEAQNCINRGYCPLCAHDFYIPATCHECGHAFVFVPFGCIAIIPLLSPV